MISLPQPVRFNLVLVIQTQKNILIIFNYSIMLSRYPCLSMSANINLYFKEITNASLPVSYSDLNLMIECPYVNTLESHLK